MFIDFFPPSQIIIQFDKIVLILESVLQFMFTTLKIICYVNLINLISASIV